MHKNMFMVGSTSPIKLNATKKGLRIVSITNHCVRGIPTESGVPNQPIGYEQILLGAINRMEQARKYNLSAYAIGIENGCILDNGQYYDIAVIVIQEPHNPNYHVEITNPIRVPNDYVKESIRTRQNTTVGALLTRDNPNCSAQDPHAWLTNNETNREQLITEALVKMFAKIFNQNKEMIMNKTHVINVGDFRLELPIIEVKPGVHVALFDPMGNHELNEALGKKLARLIPKETNLLVMPDGKAQALLHVVGRETGLKTIIFRKTPKYLIEPIITANVNSITTAGTQYIYAGAKQIAEINKANVCVLDDVYSTGNSECACKEIINKAGGKHLATLVVLTEGKEPPPNIISLGHLPLF